MLAKQEKQKTECNIDIYISVRVHIYFLFRLHDRWFYLFFSFGTGCGIDGYYHATLPNGYELETISDDFDREYFTGYIRKDGKDVIEWVTKIKVSGDSIYGERYFVNEAPGSEYYFVIDSKSGIITQYKSFREADEKRSDPSNRIDSLGGVLLQKLVVGYSFG